MSAPKFSVVMTCYNYGKYLSGAVDSVLKQTLQDFEIVIVNDGSTDDSEQVMKRYADHPKIRCISQKNGGQANAKNRGIRETHGELVAFLDADDAWEPQKLEKQARLFQDPQIGVVYSRMRYVDEHDAPVAPPAVPLRLWRGDILREMLLDNFIPFSSSVVRREALDRLGAFDESLELAIDWDLWLRVATAYCFDYLDEPLIAYRVNHPGRISKNLELRQACCDRIFKNFTEKFADRIRPDDLRRAQIYTYNNRAYYYRRIAPDRSKSLNFALNSIRCQPFQIYGWRAFVLALVSPMKRPTHG